MHGVEQLRTTLESRKLYIARRSWEPVDASNTMHTEKGEKRDFRFFPRSKNEEYFEKRECIRQKLSAVN